jgi:hypothetical protein
MGAKGNVRSFVGKQKQNSYFAVSIYFAPVVRTNLARWHEPGLT